MVSLSVQDAVNVEITPLNATLRPAQALQLSATVVPAYADDLTVLFRSTDETVATVTPSGLVTALAPGSCEIIAATPNGCEDACQITIK